MLNPQLAQHIAHVNENDGEYGDGEEEKLSLTSTNNNVDKKQFDDNNNDADSKRQQHKWFNFFRNNKRGIPLLLLFTERVLIDLVVFVVVVAAVATGLVLRRHNNNNKNNISIIVDGKQLQQHSIVHAVFIVILLFLGVVSVSVMLPIIYNNYVTIPRIKSNRRRQNQRIQQCRNYISSLLGTIGSPPLEPLPVPMGDNHDKNHINKDNITVPMSSSLYQPLLLLRGQDDTDMDTIIQLLDDCTTDIVNFIQIIDELLDHVRVATSMRYGFLGSNNASQVTTTTTISSSLLLVDRLERTMISRSYNRCDKKKSSSLPTTDANGGAEEESENDEAPSATVKNQQRRRQRPTMSTPFPILRKNLSTTLIQQHNLLLTTILTITSTGEADEYNSDNNKDDFRHQYHHPQDVITISWLRSIRNDICNVLSKILDVAFSISVDSSSLMRSTILEKYNMMGGLKRASAHARTAKAYLLSSSKPPPVEEDIPCTSESKLNPLDSIQFQNLQHQTKALQVALMALREVPITSTTGGDSSVEQQQIVENQELRSWWTRVKNIYGDITSSVEHLEEIMFQNPDHRDGSAGAEATSSDNPEDEGAQIFDSTALTSEEEYNANESVESHKIPHTKPASLDHNEKKTLVYSGKGAVEREKHRSFRRSRGNTSSPGNTAATASRVVQCDNSATVHFDLIQELQDRLLAMPPLEEVDANFSIDSIDGNEENCDALSAAAEADQKQRAGIMPSPSDGQQLLGELQHAMKCMNAMSSEELVHGEA